jgi:glycosyltransferase involved in cell wall biosynthesis
LLIYAKNGHRPGLLEFLANMFRSHVQIHYGKFKREELADAASKSRACVYLADDDHGPLALQEILLSGCPVVGVSTGASFVKDGVTGVMVDKMPSSPEFHLSYDDSQFLIRYLSAIGLAMTLDRQAIREFALNQFDENAITDKIIECLQAIRKSI